MVDGKLKVDSTLCINKSNQFFNGENIKTFTLRTYDTNNNNEYSDFILNINGEAVQFEFGGFAEARIEEKEQAMIIRFTCYKACFLVSTMGGSGLVAKMNNKSRLSLGILKSLLFWI